MSDILHPQNVFKNLHHLTKSDTKSTPFSMSLAAKKTNTKFK